MATYRLLGAAAVFAMVTAPAMAQQAMGEPGYCAFYYPNANCQNKGPGNPETVGVARKRTHKSAIRMQ